jgi:hypothetical protein
VRDELVSRKVAALVKVSTPPALRTLVWTVDHASFLRTHVTRRIPITSPTTHSGSGSPAWGSLGLGWDDIDLDAGKTIIAWQLQRVRG